MLTERLGKSYRSSDDEIIERISYAENLRKNIVIDEAVELAKKFGNDSSSKFINGVLDNLER